MFTGILVLVIIMLVYFRFPSSKDLYDVDTQFMWGKSIMIVPVLEEVDKVKLRPQDSVT